MQKIALSLIKPSPNPIRKSWRDSDEQKIQELAQSIKEQGVIVPIKVRPVQEWIDNCTSMQSKNWPMFCKELQDYSIEKYGRENFHGEPGLCAWCDYAEWAYDEPDELLDLHDNFDIPKDWKPYEVVYGHRRVEAAKRAGLEEIPVNVESPDDTDALIQAMLENLQREDMCEDDKAESLGLLRDSTGWSAREIARRGILSHPQIGRYLGLLDETEITRSVVRNEPVGVQHVAEMKTAGVDQPGVREKIVLKASNEGMTYRETRAVADAYVKADTPELKQSVLETSGKQGDAGAILRKAKRDLGDEFFEEVEREEKREKILDLPRLAGNFIDANKAYRKEVDLILEAIEHDIVVFSPEGVNYVTRRVDGTISKLEQLMEVLNG